MLNMSERQQLATQLKALEATLHDYAALSVTDLDPALQKAIRSYDIIGPVTSSGIEKVTSIIDRLIWAAYYLNDPNFPQSHEQRVAPPTPPTAPVQPSQQPPDHHPSSGQHTELEFGPYDPRQRKE